MDLFSRIKSLEAEAKKALAASLEMKAAVESTHRTVTPIMEAARLSLDVLSVAAEALKAEAVAEPHATRLRAALTTWLDRRTEVAE